MQFSDEGSHGRDIDGNGAWDRSHLPHRALRPLGDVHFRGISPVDSASDDPGCRYWGSDRFSTDDFARCHENFLRIYVAGHDEIALWSGTNMNRDVSTGPIARPFSRSLALLTLLLAPDCSLRLRPPLPSLVRSLALFALVSK